MQHADLVKSAEDAHTYLVHDNTDPLQASLSGLLLEGLPPMAASTLAPRTGAPPCLAPGPSLVSARLGQNVAAAASMCCLASWL